LKPAPWTIDILEARAKDAKAKIAYFEGKTDTHPHGQSGKLIPYELSSRIGNGDYDACWQTNTV
jgi:hypothetical protein